MIILPAIDIIDKTCVRLVMGEYGTAHKVAENPLETALKFKECGAEYIHMVDLDGAKAGKKINHEVFLEVAKKAGVPVELGGGIRDMETIEFYLNNGISRVILGSVVLTNKTLVEMAVEKYRDKIAVGIDAKNRKVKTSGWLEENEVDFLTLAKEMKNIGVKNIIYTDISKDGTLSGVNLAHYNELSEIESVDITASGGVGGIDDIVNLKKLNIYGVICGKAIYSGNLDLKEAIKTAKHP